MADNQEGEPEAPVQEVIPEAPKEKVIPLVIHNLRVVPVKDTVAVLEISEDLKYKASTAFICSLQHPPTCLCAKNEKSEVISAVFSATVRM